MQYPAPVPTAPLPRRRGQRRAAAGWSLLFATVLLGGVFAADLPHAAAPANAAPTPQVVQHVVEQQLHALSVQDASQAFALADTAMRTQFGDADTFFATVREQYPMLLHPASVLFLKPATDGHVALQKVRITDEAGSNWSLTYLLNRQDDQWRISGCVVTPQGKQVLT